MGDMARAERHRLEGIERGMADPDPHGTSARERVSMVYQEFHRAQENAHTLEKLLAQLAEDLGPVLGPERPEPDGGMNVDEQQESSPLAMQLESHADHLMRLGSRLRGVLARLEV